MAWQPPASQRLGGPIRALLVVSAAGLTGLLGLARVLEPDPRGYGTHAQLGLRPCTFLALTGHPCPTCGMTTSFAWLTRGRIDRAWSANPAGCLLALFTPALAAWLLWSAAAGRSVGARSLAGPLASVLAAAVVLGVAFWVIRLQ
jgi:Protein of unknown function (DUF2752)